MKQAQQQQQHQTRVGMAMQHLQLPHVGILEDKHQHHQHGLPSSSSSSLLAPSPHHVDSIHLVHPKYLPPPPTPPSPELYQNLDKRPSTAPGPQSSSSPSSDALLPLPTAGFKANRVGSVRKSPTVSDLHIPKRSNSSRGKPGSNNNLSATSDFLSPNTRPASKSLSRSSSRSERRSSSARRPPASFSANGIETSYGPPPALITRNAYHSELARLAQNPAASTLAAQQQKPYNTNTFPLRPSKPSRVDSANSRPPSREHIIEWSQPKGQGLLSPTSFTSNTMESLESIMNQGRSSWRQTAPSDRSNDISPGTMPRSSQQPSEEGMESSHSSEDLFLKLANDGSEQASKDVAEVTSQLDHFHIRGRQPKTGSSFASETPSHSLRRNSSPAESLPAQKMANFSHLTGYRRPSGAASVVGVPTTRQTLHSTPEQKLANYRARYNSPQTPSGVSRVPEQTAVSHRRASATEQLIARGQYQRQSRLHNIDNSPIRTNSLIHDPRTDVDSVVSTVQSHVWDETPEMKTRFHRQDFGRGTASSGSNERPRTATTTVTTVSSSPKVAMGLKSFGDTRPGAIDVSNLHPNLHQSLTRCRNSISPAVFRALESAANEALEMAASARLPTTNGSIYASSQANGIVGDRQMKRKADNICRNLTDLCVALIESQTPQDPNNRFSTQSLQQRRESREIPQMVPKLPQEIPQKSYSRHASLEPEMARPASSRALERVEARRVSLLGNATPASSPREAPQTVAQRALPEQAKSSPLATNFLRSGTSLLRTRRAQHEDEDDQPNLRAPSRAVTEVGSMLRKRGDRIPSNLNTSRTIDTQYNNLQPSHTSALRRVTGGNSPLSPTTQTSSLLRGASRLFGGDRLTPGDSTEEDEKKIKRRSLGLYSSNSTSTRPHGLRPASLSARRTSLAAGE